MKQIPEEAWKTLPKKPEAIYLKFRRQKLLEYKDLEDRTDRIKKEWHRLHKDVKDQMQRQKEQDQQAYPAEIKKWKELHGATDGDIEDWLQRQRKAKTSRQAKTKKEKLWQDQKAFSLHVAQEVRNKLLNFKFFNWKTMGSDEYRELCEKVRIAINQMINCQLK